MNSPLAEPLQDWVGNAGVHVRRGARTVLLTETVFKKLLCRVRRTGVVTHRGVTFDESDLLALQAWYYPLTSPCVTCGIESSRERYCSDVCQDVASHATEEQRVAWARHEAAS